MRLWNGLKLNDIIKYHEMVYRVIKLYELDNKRVCDLQSLSDNKVINAISVYECMIKEV